MGVSMQGRLDLGIHEALSQGLCRQVKLRRKSATRAVFDYQLAGMRMGYRSCQRKAKPSSSSRSIARVLASRKGFKHIGDTFIGNTGALIHHRYYNGRI